MKWSAVKQKLCFWSKRTIEKPEIKNIEEQLPLFNYEIPVKNRAKQLFLYKEFDLESYSIILKLWKPLNLPLFLALF